VGRVWERLVEAAPDPVATPETMPTLEEEPPGAVDWKPPLGIDVEAVPDAPVADPVLEEDPSETIDWEPLLDVDVEAAAAPDPLVEEVISDATLELCGEWLTHSTSPIFKSQALSKVGFHALRAASVMPNSVQIAEQVSPETTVYVSVHAVGVADAEVETVVDAEDEAI